MEWTVAKEDTHLGSKLEFTRVVFSETRPTRASKDAKKRIIGIDVEETLDGCHIFESLTRHAINKIAGCKKSFIPIAEWKRGMS